jgi:beta-galactosidase
MAMSLIINLDTDWELALDSSNRGIDERWYVNKPDSVQKIDLPHTLEEEFGKYSGNIAFYFKSFFIDKNDASKRYLLRITRSFFHTTVWLNGKPVGTHMGGYNVIDIDPSKAVREGEINHLCIRVESCETGKKIADLPIVELPMGRPFFRKPFGGIWGDVQFICGGRGFMQNMNVINDIDNNKLTLEIQFNNQKNLSTRIMVQIENPKGEISTFIKEIRLDRENSLYRLNLEVQEMYWWELDNPALYKISVVQDKSNALQMRFGFRKFDVLKGEFYLNDKIIKIHGITYSLSRAIKGIIHTGTDAIRQELENIKAMGFNTIRSGGAPLPEELLCICDEIGLMVWQEMPIFKQKSSKEGLELVRTVVASLIESSKSHPSICTWVLGNENGTLMLENGTKLLKYVDEFDESRPAISNLNNVHIDNDGHYKKDTGKVLGVTHDKINMFHSHRIHPRMAFTLDHDRLFSRYGNSEQAKKISIEDLKLGTESFRDNYADHTSEITSKILIQLRMNLMYPDMDQIMGTYSKHKVLNDYKKLSQYDKNLKELLERETFRKLWKSRDRFFADINKLARDVKFYQTLSFLSSSQVSGFMLDEWVDFGIHMNGLCAENRKLKPHTQEFAKALNTPSRVLATSFNRNPFPGAKIKPVLNLLNGLRLPEFEYMLQIVKQDGTVVVEKKGKESYKTFLQPLDSMELVCPQEEGEYILRTVLKAKGKDIALTDYPMWIFSKQDMKSLKNQYVFIDDFDDEKEVIKAIDKHDVIISSYLAQWSPELLTTLILSAEKGKTIILTDLAEADVEQLNTADEIPFALEGFIANGSNGSCCHYLLEAPCFAGLKGPGMMQIEHSEIMPSYSLKKIEDSETYGGSILFSETGGIRLGQDLQILHLGSGKVVFSQYPLMDKLESNSLAETLFYQLFSWLTL